MRCEYEIAVDDDPHRETGPDRNRRLNVEVAADDLLPGLIQAVGAATPQRRYDGAVVVGGAEVRADAKHRRERRRHQQPAPMMIDFVLEPGKSLRVGAGLALQDDRAPVRHEQPRPDQEHAVLPERDLAVIDADKLAALWDEALVPGRAFVAVLAHGREEL